MIQFEWIDLDANTSALNTPAGIVLRYLRKQGSVAMQFVPGVHVYTNESEEEFFLDKIREPGEIKCENGTYVMWQDCSEG